VIALDLPLPLMWALRWALFLGPLVLVMLLGWRARFNKRMLIGALFAFLYGTGVVFVTHMVAIRLGWWHYGGDVLMLQGLPVDIWFGGALLFGPVLYLAFPNVAPFWLVLPIIVGLHGTVFSSLRPLVIAGPGWLAGVVLVFIIAHLPALYLARWTARDERLPLRAGLLAFGYGCVAFIVIPSLILHCTGGQWGLDTIAPWRLIAGVLLCLPLIVMGLTAVQMFAVHGQGTAIPLDPTKRLVGAGIFAYLTNPMQACTAAIWLVMGAVLGNAWVASAAIMAWVFVVGMVRWHHRNDLLRRFPEGWPEYRAHVGEWRPRWRPWFAHCATLIHDPASPRQARFVELLARRGTVSLEVMAVPGARLAYREPNETRIFTGMAGRAKALGHVHFGWALVGATVLLLVLPFQAPCRPALLRRETVGA
jgi:protein-S-isoprenylcysteine O-methyltransferase Ste14